MKQHRILGANERQVQEMYEESVLSTLRPQVVVNIACARERTVMLLADGNVYEFPRQSLPRVVKFPPRAQGRIKKLAAGDSHFVAMTDHLVWNVYTWGSSNAEGQLGRTTTKGEEHVPEIVKDIAGRVVDISCGANFTLCCTSTGEMYGFGSRELNFGQQRAPSSSSTVDEVVKLYWAGESERIRVSGRHSLMHHQLNRTTTGGEEDIPIHFSSNGNIGVVWRSESISTITSVGNGLSPTTSSTPAASAVMVELTTNPSSLIDSFTPRDDSENLLVRHAKQCWNKATRLSEAAHWSRLKERDMINKVRDLETSLMHQELKVESYAKTLLSFRDLEEFSKVEEMISTVSTPADTRTASSSMETTRSKSLGRDLVASNERNGVDIVKEEVNDVEEEEEEEGDDTKSDPQQRDSSSNKHVSLPSFPSLKTSSSSMTLSRKRKQVPMKIRAQVMEERAWELATRRKDAEICRKQLQDAMALLYILTQELTKLKQTLRGITRETRESEINAWEWNTRALLFERSLLRLKREARLGIQPNAVPFAASSSISTVCRAFPNATWTRELSNRRVKVLSGLSQGSSLSSTEGTDDVTELWVLARLDPDRGLRLALASLRIAIAPSSSGLEAESSRQLIESVSASIKHVFISPDGVVVDPGERQETSPRLMVPARSLLSFSTNEESTVQIDVRRHAVFHPKQIGEDLIFWVGFAFHSQSLSTFDQAGRRLADLFVGGKATLDVEVHGDEQVAERLMEEVEGREAFEPSRDYDWDKIALEVLE